MGDPTTEPTFRNEDRLRIQKLWEDAAKLENPPAVYSSAKALAFGLNFRVNLLKGLQAAWETTVLAADAGAAAAAPFNVMAWLAVGKDFISAVGTIFATVVERMQPIEYVSAVVLSHQQNPVTDTELEQAVAAYLKDPQQTRFAAYFGMNDELIQRAQEVVSNVGWFAPVLAELFSAGFVDKDAAGKLMFKAKHFEIRWKEV